MGCVCLPDDNVGHRAPPGNPSVAGDLIVKILRHIFRRGIHGCERLQIIDELMIQPVDDIADDALEFGEIDEQADGIELRPSRVTCTR